MKASPSFSMNLHSIIKISHQSQFHVISWNCKKRIWSLSLDRTILKGKRCRGLCGFIQTLKLLLLLLLYLLCWERTSSAASVDILQQRKRMKSFMMSVPSFPSSSSSLILVKITSRPRKRRRLTPIKRSPSFLLFNSTEARTMYVLLYSRLMRWPKWKCVYLMNICIYILNKRKKATFGYWTISRFKFEVFYHCIDEVMCHF